MSEVPSSNPIEAKLIEDTQTVRDIAAKTPGEHVDDAVGKTKLALGNLKQHFDEGVFPTSVEGLIEKGELQNETTKAAFDALNSLMKAGAAGSIQIAGGHMVYEPGKGIHWEALKNEVKPE